MPAAGRVAARSGLAGRLPFFYGWAVLAVAIVGMFSSGPGQASVLSVFIEPIQRETGWSRTVISGAISLATLATALAMPVVGDLVDRFGARFIIAITAFLLGIGCLLLAQSTTEPGFYAGVTAVRLLGLGVLSLTCTTLVGRWFVRRRGRAMSAAVIGMAVGIAAFPPILQQIIDGAGWRAAWVFLAVAVWAILILPALVVVRDRPEDLGLLPDGDAAPPPAPDGSPAQPAAVARGWQVREIVRLRTFWLLLLATATPFFVNVAVTFHQVPLLTDNGLTAQVAALIVSFYALCYSGGSLVSGWLLDHFTLRPVLVGTLLVLSGSILVLMNARSIPLAAAYGVTFGLAAGSNTTVERSVWPAYFGRQNLGRINGVVLLVRMAAASAGPLLAGLAYDRLGEYGPFFLALAVIPLFCAAVALLVGPPPRR